MPKKPKGHVGLLPAGVHAFRSNGDHLFHHKDKKPMKVPKHDLPKGKLPGSVADDDLD
eukprot:gene27431-21458_t